jgi:hypothetical protein
LRKSDEITTTPTRGSSAVVTPSTKMREREQANAKKIKQGKKKGLEGFLARDQGYQPYCRRALRSMPSYSKEKIGVTTAKRGTSHT